MKPYIEPEMEITFIDFSDIVTSSEPHGAEATPGDGTITTGGGSIDLP